VYECDCCGRPIVPQKLKGIGYYCDDCLPFWIGEDYWDEDMPSHLPVCPFKVASP
jgi:hypothetical protein